MDKYNFDFINSISPLMVRMYGDNNTHDLELFCVQTGCMTMNVSGLPQNIHFDDVKEFVDWNGDIYQPEQFYLEEQNQ